MTVYYLLIALSTLLFSTQFVFQKMYQRERGQSFHATCVYSFLTCLFFGIFMWGLNGFTLQIAPFSVLLAFCSAGVSLTCRYFGLLAMSIADLAKYSLYLMLGGMVVPFLYGIFFNGDGLGVPKLICFVLLVVAVFVNKLGGKKIDATKRTWKARVCYAVLFLTNGLVGVISSIHQNKLGDMAVPSRDFTILSMAANVILSGMFLLLLWAFSRKRSGLPKASEEGKSMSSGSLLRTGGAVVGYAATNGVGNYILLISLVHVQPSVQYSMVTGGCILLSVLLGVIFGEKITWQKMLSAVLIIVGTLLLLIP